MTNDMSVAVAVRCRDCGGNGFDRDQYPPQTYTKYESTGCKKCGGTGREQSWVPIHAFKKYILEVVEEAGLRIVTDVMDA